MKYSKIKGLKNDVSRMVFGCDWIKNDTKDNEQISKKALNEVISIGCNTFDTGHIYCGGYSERMLGQWMQENNNREKVYILTKCSHHNQDRKRVTPFDIESDMHDSMTRLKTDYIDILLLHRDDISVEVGPIVEVLNKYQSLGKIKVFGGSNWTHQRIEEANEYAYKHNLQPFSVSSPNFSLAEQIQNPWSEGCVSLNGPDNKEARKWYQKNKDVRIFAYSSLARGFFSGLIKSDMKDDEGKKILDTAARLGYFHPVNLKRLSRVEEMAKNKNLSIAQIAMAYVINHELDIFSLQSPRNIVQMKENDMAMDLILTRDEMAWLNLEI